MTPTPSEIVALAGVTQTTERNNNTRSYSVSGKLTSKISEVEILVRKILDSASIRNFRLEEQGTRYRITIPRGLHVPKIVLNKLESNGITVHTISSSEQGLEIHIGGIRK